MSLSLVRRFKVWVLSVDEDRRRIGLSAVGPGDGKVAAASSAASEKNGGKRQAIESRGSQIVGVERKSRPSQTIHSLRFLNNLHFLLRCAYVATLPT